MPISSPEVISNQDGLHRQLQHVVQKHLNSSYRKPIAQHNQTAFESAQQFVAQHNRPIILDACCGIAESSRKLALQYPEHIVIGVDKSAHRLNKCQTNPDNCLLLRADLADFWRLATNAGWQLERHYMLYPNPWPKAKHLQRRWHGSALFPTLLALGGQFELRSNWQVYVQEFVAALDIAGIQVETEALSITNPMTAFERKYFNSGHNLWRCCANFADLDH